CSKVTSVRGTFIYRGLSWKLGASYRYHVTSVRGTFIYRGLLDRPFVLLIHRHLCSRDFHLSRNWGKNNETSKYRVTSVRGTFIYRGSAARAASCRPLPVTSVRG